MNDPLISIDRQVERALPRLERLTAQPSISAQNVGLDEMAALTAQTLQEDGFADVQILPTRGGPPVVYGEMAGRADRTLLIYNHYDVQPAEPLALWESPPFAPARRDGKAYGRGISDNKGGIVTRLAAIAAWREAQGAPPLHIKFLIEGEEESGSPHFRAFVQEHADLLRADGCLMEEGGVTADGRPVLSAGMKGLLNLELSVRSAQTDAHSANAPVVPSAAWRLLWALASLKTPDERIQIEGFYDDIRPLNDTERAALRALKPGDEAARRALGVTQFLGGVSGAAWTEQLYQSPTCNICGFLTGYTGPGPKTVLPCEARAKVDFRLVPNQKPHDILAKLRQHLAARGFGDVEIAILGAEGPARTPVDHPLVRLAVEAAAEVYGKKPVLYVNSAGTQPMDVVVEALGIPALSPTGGAGYDGSLIHAPNEHIRIADLAPAIRYNARLLQRLAEDGSWAR